MANVWPSADKFNELIHNAANGGQLSPLEGMGDKFIAYGKLYGIDPSVIAGTIMKECHFMTVPDALAPLNNFGGNTSGDGAYPGPCGSKFVGDRAWKVFCTPEQGLEGVFKVFDQDIYRATDGTLGAIMEIYSPSFENNVDDMFAIYAEVGRALGVTLGRETQVYGNKQTKAECLAECQKLYGPSVGLPNLLDVGDPAMLAKCSVMCTAEDIKSIPGTQGAGQAVDAAGTLLNSVKEVIAKLPDYFMRSTLALIGLLILGFGLYKLMSSK